MTEKYRVLWDRREEANFKNSNKKKPQQDKQCPQNQINSFWDANKNLVTYMCLKL